MDNTAEVLIQDIYQRGVILKVEGNELRFKPQSRMTPELLGRLRNHKTEVISKLTTPVGVTETPKTIEKRTGFADRDCRNPTSDGISVLRPGHSLASFDHDSVFVGTPRWIQHKDPSCESTEFWQHRWGSFHCSVCWPYTDAVIRIETDDKPEPRQESGNQPKPATEWTTEEKQLVDWLTDSYDRLIDETETFQHQIDIAGLMLVLRRGPAAQGSKQAVSDLKALQRDPKEFHAEMERRHERELGQWNPRYGREKGSSG